MSRNRNRNRNGRAAAPAPASAARPGTLAELAAVKGMGPHRIEQYGEQILQLVGGAGSG